MRREFSFDRQAQRFDARAGLPAAVSQEVAAAVAARAGLEPGELLLDLGAGTGEIGAALCRRLPAGVRYLALDLSFGMLREFGAKIRRDRIPPSGGEGRGGARLTVAVADGSRRWPLESGKAAAIFCSRAAHLVEAAVFLAEARRVLRPGGLVLLGSLERSRESVRAELRSRMRTLLGDAGSGQGRGGQDRGGQDRGGRDSRKRHRQLAEELGGGCEQMVAATFAVEERPADSLAAWRSKRGLAGLELTVEKQEEVLGRLEEWARERYVDLNRPQQAIERYELLIVRVGQGEEKV